MQNDDKNRFEGLVPRAPEDDDTLFDRLFTEAAERHLAEQDIYPKREELEKEISFTPEFDDRMTAILKRFEKEQRKRRHRSRISVHLFRAASVIITAFIVFGLFMVTSTAAQNRVLNFFHVFNEGSVDISFSNESGATDDLVLYIPEGAYQAAYLPKGFVLDTVVPRSNATELIYVSDDQAIQIVTYTEANGTTLNRESAKISEFTCLGVSATQLATDREVIIYFEKDGALVTLYANIPASELRKVAENLTK